MNIVWTGAADSNWNNAANWNPQQVPGLGDTATFPPGIYTVNTASYSTQIVDGINIGDGVTINIADIGQLQVGGTIANTGAISVNQGDSANLLIGTADNAAVTLEGGGVIALGQQGQIDAGVAGASLDNIDNTIEGSGLINGGIALTNEIGGVIDANAAGGAALDIYGTVVTNDGLIEATGNGVLNLDEGAVLDQSATGTLDAAGSHLTLVNVTIQGGTLTSPAGAMYVGRSNTALPLLDGTGAGGLTNLANVVLDDDGVVSLAGAIHNQGSFIANEGDGAQILIGGTPGAAVTLDGGGSITLGQAGQIDAGVAGASLDNIDNTIAGSGLINGNITLTNEIAGTIDANAAGGAPLDIYGTAVTNDGLIEASGGGVLNLNYGAVLDQSATGTLDAAGAPLYLYNVTIQGGTLDTSGNGAIYAGRSNTALPLLDGTVAGGLTNLGSFVVQDVGVVSLAGAIHNQGSFSANQGDSAQILIGGTPSAAVTLDGGGSVSLGQQGQIDAGVGGASLDNIDNTIEGSGLINGGFALTNEVAGVIDGNAASGATLNIYNGQIVNAGLIEASGAGSLTLTNGASVVQSATGTLAADGAPVELISATITGGTLDAAAGGGFYAGRSNNGLPLLDGAVAGGLTLRGGFVVQDDGVVTLAGAIHNEGSFSVNQGDSAQVLVGATADAAVTLNGGGSITLGQQGQIDAGVGGASLDNLNNTIEGSGLINGGFAFTNAAGGVVDANAGGRALDLYGTDLLNAGTVEASNGGVLNVNYNAFIDNAGTLGAGPGGTANLDVPIISNGVLLAEGGIMTVNAGISGAGVIEIEDHGLAVLNTASGMNATFRGTGGTLRLPDLYTGVISGIAAGDEIDLPNQPPNPGNPTFPPPELSPPADPYSSYWGGGNGQPNNYLTLAYVPNANDTGGTLTVYEHAIYSWINADNDNNYAGSAYAVFPVWSVQLAGAYSPEGFILDSDGSEGGSAILYQGGGSNSVWANPVSGSWQTAADWASGRAPISDATVTLGQSGAYTVTDSFGGVTTLEWLTVSDAAATLDIVGGTTVSTNAGAVQGAVQALDGSTFMLLGNLVLSTGGSLLAQSGSAQILLQGGYISGGGNITVGADGVLQASGAGLTSVIAGHVGITDAGSVQAGGGGTLTLAGVTVNAAGGWLSATGGAVLLAGATILQGTLNDIGGAIATAAQTDSTLKGATLSAGSLLQVTDASTLTLAGSIDNAGTLNLGGGADATVLAISGHVTLGGGGAVSLTDSAANAILATGAGAYLFNAADFLTGAGSIGGGDGLLSLSNQTGGTIEATGSNKLILDTGNTVANGGVLGAAAGGMLVVDDALTSHGTLLTGGSVDLAGTSDTLSGSITGDGRLSAAGAVAITANLVDTAAATSFLGGLNLTGTLTAAGAQLFVAAGATGTGAYRIGAAAELSFGGAVSAATIGFVGSDGTLAVQAGSMPQAEIKGFTTGDTIDIGGLPLGDIIGKSFAGNTLTIDITGGGSERLDFASGYALHDFTFQTDAAGTGTAVLFHA